MIHSCASGYHVTCGHHEEAYGLWALTRDPMRAGTVSYMCPQMLSGGAVSYFCDVFSFGVVMQEVLTGEMAEGRRAMRQPRSGHALGPRHISLAHPWN